MVSTDMPMNDEIVAAEAAEGKTDYRDTYPSDTQGLIATGLLAAPVAAQGVQDAAVACIITGCAQKAPQWVQKSVEWLAGDGDPTNELGQLRNVGQSVWESTAGLRYGPDPNFGNRVQHVVNHTVDRANRLVHGVFNSRTDALSIVDEAWQKIQQEGITGVTQGTRTVYTVDMGRVIGYVGGQQGAAAGYPDASHLQLVIEGANEVITAFPVIP